MRDIVMEKARKVGDILTNPLAVKKVDLETNKEGTRVTKIRAKLKDKSKTESIMKVFQANLGCNHGRESKSVVDVDKKEGLITIDKAKVHDGMVFDLAIALVLEEIERFGKRSKCDSSGKKSKCDSSDFPEDIPPEALFLIMGKIAEMENAPKKVR
jgi:hypothetical protein